MIARRVAAILFLPLMLAFGSGVYLYLGTLKSKVVREHAQVPTVTRPRFVLQGTMFVVQDGRIYKLNNGGFSEIGPAGDWSQPALTPDHTQLVAVSHSGFASDLYLLDVNGNVIKRLTSDSSRIIDGNHWAYYPRVTPDGSSVVYSYDSPKFGYTVDFSIWSMPLNGSQRQARLRAQGIHNTGGDTSPLPISPTGLLYVSHAIDQSTVVHSTIYLQSRPGAISKALTNPADDCSQPALSPDGTQLAMICRAGKQTTRLEVAPFNGTVLGPARTVLEGGLYAQPTWSPDGKALAYFAPAGATGHFQLWYLAVPPAATPAASMTAGASPAAIVFPTPAPTPVQVTEGVDLSATSPPAWY
ncbi:MAG TPA: hypothetical protein VFR68_11045 [Candidatus Dormibacteraeota bacterium]|nr:hypothetical protein [Candidatus Dormibacteraeota bacterium]